MQLRENLDELMKAEDSLEVLQKKLEYSKPHLPKSSQRLLQNLSIHWCSQKEKQQTM